MTPNNEALQARTAWLAGQVAAGLPLSPGRLRRYSDAGGLVGVAHDECRWVTNTRLLNDATELLYGRDLARDRLLACVQKPALKRKPATICRRRSPGPSMHRRRDPR